MALLTSSLSVWEISFRWAGLDPDRLWLRLPLPVKDSFRLLMEAILDGEILCETLTLAKRPSNSKADPQYYIRTHIDEVYSCIHGKHFSRKLLKWAFIDRYELREWCESMSIPLPEFWFPPGWKYSFEMPEYGTKALSAEHVEPDTEGNVNISFETYVNEIQPLNARENNSQLPTKRDNQKSRIACQKIAERIWKDDPSRTIASVVKDDLIQKYGGASPYQPDTVRKWIKVVAPPGVRNSPGRRKKG